MAKAGFWAIGGYKISFRADGNWYADEEVIANPKIALLFSRHIQADGEGGWVIDLGIDRQHVAVEDTPLVVCSCEGDAVSGFRIKTNDGETGDLDCSTLRVGSDNVLYCDVDRTGRGRMAARFLRPAYYRLAACMEDAASGPTIACRGRSYTVRTVEKA